MSDTFWTALSKPIHALAPMADVTDAAFRRVIAQYGKPDIMWTEFVSADGLFLGGKESLMRDLWYTEAERPIIAQFFSPDPGRMKKAARLAVELGFDGIDLNMGCPDKNVCKQGSGAAMIRTPETAREVIEATMEGARHNGRHIPVSVKTRAGYVSDAELDDWISLLLSTRPAAITLHARTKKDMSKVPARWGLVARAVELRDDLGSETLVLGNGDVGTLADIERRSTETRADGVMVGRGIFGNPWFFSREVCSVHGCFIGHPTELLSVSECPCVTVEKRLRVLVEHTLLFEELLGGKKNFSVMKKHYKAYVSGWDGARELRGALMDAHDAREVKEIAERFRKDLLRSSSAVEV